MKKVQNEMLSCLVSDDSLVKDIHLFGRKFRSDTGLLHYGCSHYLDVEVEDYVHPELPAFVRKVDVYHSDEAMKSFELWFHQNFKDETDDQIAFYSPCEQSVIHYIDGVYLLFTVEGEVANKSIRYAISNDARPSYQKLKNHNGTHCWQPLASGRIDSTLCLEGLLSAGRVETLYFKMVAALSEDELFTYYDQLNHADSFYSMRHLDQHATKMKFPSSNSVEPQSC